MAGDEAEEVSVELQVLVDFGVTARLPPHPAPGWVKLRLTRLFAPLYCQEQESVGDEIHTLVYTICRVANDGREKLVDLWQIPGFQSTNVVDSAVHLIAKTQETFQCTMQAVASKVV